MPDTHCPSLPSRPHHPPVLPRQAHNLPASGRHIVLLILARRQQPAHLSKAPILLVPAWRQQPAALARPQPAKFLYLVLMYILLELSGTTPTYGN